MNWLVAGAMVVAGLAGAAIAFARPPAPDDAPPSPLTDEELARAIIELTDPARAYQARDRLESEPSRARARLLAALEEPAFLVEPPDGEPAGVTHVLYLLEQGPTDATLERARSLAGHAHRALRAGVGRLLARRGDGRDVEGLSALLTDPEERVRADTVVGVWLRHEERPLPPKEAAALFPALVEALRRSVTTNDRQLPALLVALDRGRALPLFQTPELLRADLGCLAGVLEALNEARVVVPVDALLALVPPLDARAAPPAKGDDPRPALIGLLARHAGPRVDEVLLRYSTCPADYPAYLAAEARCERAGLDPEGVIAEAEAALGDRFPDGLSETRLVYVLARGFDYEVKNGGFRQLFGNSSGDYARETLAALRAIGCPVSAGLLERAISEFGPDGPPRDHEERIARRSALRPKEGERVLFDGLDKAFYAGDEPVMARVHLWVLAHPDEFRQRARR